MNNKLIWILLAVAAVAAYFMLRKKDTGSVTEGGPIGGRKANPLLSDPVLNSSTPILMVDTKPAVNPGLIGGTAASLGPLGVATVVNDTKLSALVNPVSNFTPQPGLASTIKQYGNCTCANGTQCVGQGNCACCDKKIAPMPYDILMRRAGGTNMPCNSGICYYNNLWPGCLHCRYAPFGAQFNSVTVKN